MSSDGAYLRVAVRHRLGTLALDAGFELRADWTVLFGPSGSGKSTLLRCVAGLTLPDAGSIEVLGKVVTDRAAGVQVATVDRGIRWAGQRSMLFPHRTVEANLALGARGAKVEGLAQRFQDYVDELVAHFGLGELAKRYPAELSGGQRQIVSVVRAAAGAQGRVLLLDEPFAGLDAEVRDRLIEGLRTWLQGSPGFKKALVVSVTHDVGEAFLLGAEVVRLREGRVVGQGPVGEVLRGERERLLGVLG